MLEKIKTFTKKHKMEFIRIGLLALVIGLQATNVYADDGTAKLDGVITFFCSWFQKIGLVVALIGGVQFGLAFKSDDANGKTNAIRMIAAGFMVWGVGASPSIFMGK